VNIDFFKGNCKQDVYFVALNVKHENINFLSANRFVKCVEGQAVDFNLGTHCLVGAERDTGGVDDFALAMKLRELDLFEIKTALNRTEEKKI
jgi:hypothetical protein